MSTYAEYQAALGPPWLQGPKGQALAKTLGGLKDAIRDRLVYAVQAGLVNVAPDDALPSIGRDRMLPQYPSEDASAYRARLAGAWSFWQQAGTVPGLTLAMKQLGYATRIVEHGRGEPAKWAEFSVYLSAATIDQQVIKWGATGITWGGGTYWGVSTGDAARIKGILNLVKPAHATLRNVFLIVGNGLTDVWDNALGSWNDGSAWGYVIQL
ncbi:MAG TPA: phage tail protein [Deinococcales bacterium]|nr:phage tail protein [Deinococcales bacterium]